jgi:hypothetical protein
MRSDQSDQPFPRYYPIHLDQEQLFAGLLALPAYSASTKVICFIGKLGGWSPGILPNTGSLLQVFLRDGLKKSSSENSAQ